MMLRLGAAGDVDALSEGGLVGGRLVRGEEGVELVELGEGESRGEGTGEGVVAGTVVPVPSGNSEATAAPVPEKARQAPTVSATTRRLRTRSPRSVMYDGGAERARD
ncbi:hypothetical protein ACFC5Z_07260 [Streptomyces sp. NPDC056004]|uniref:hypothetical protein n=1 Tax=unclassified Streptomyces TaxID=2593676 RepID=UPI0035D99CB2